MLFVALIALSPWSVATKALVDPEWLASRLHDPDIQIVDARPPAAYLAGHISGAVNLPVDATFGDAGRADRLGGVSKVRRLIQEAGLRSDKHVVLYDDGSFINAARLFWVLEVFGQQRVSVLNAGFPSWRAAGLPDSFEPTRLPASDYKPRIQSKHMATALATRIAMDNPSVVIIDARAEDEYQGKRSTARRSGHIPSAISIPWSDNITNTDNGPRLVPMDRLASLYRERVGDRTAIAYCNKGKQSALTYFVLRNLGYQVAAYDGSWFEWGNNPDLPITTPAAQPDTR